MAERDPNDIYERIKRELDPLKVFDFLGLTMKPASSPTAGRQYRGPDPVCGRGGDRILVYTVGLKTWCCHSPICSPEGQKKKGGDIIGLVAHVKGIKQAAAAQLLKEHFFRQPEPDKPKRKVVNRRKAKINQNAAVDGTGTPEGEYNILDHMSHWS